MTTPVELELLGAIQFNFGFKCRTGNASGDRAATIGVTGQKQMVPGRADLGASMPSIRNIFLGMQRSWHLILQMAAGAKKVIL